MHPPHHRRPALTCKNDRESEERYELMSHLKELECLAQKIAALEQRAPGLTAADMQALLDMMKKTDARLDAAEAENKELKTTLGFSSSSETHKDYRTRVTKICTARQ